ncbi:PepSY domain-containing protein, partial [Primorskyibacter sp. 2E233]|uniref:PepSY domain-containing protein n=1 Tax=Primorskyibacter sp. 2E233 TaxID=3413431 RepID=UPI003BF1DCEF
MKTKLLLSTGAALLFGTMAFADAFNDQVVAQLQSQGFQTLEIKTRNGQTKFEAVRGDQKLEVVYDRATGKVVSQEMKQAKASEQTAEKTQTQTQTQTETQYSDDNNSGSDDNGTDDNGTDDHSGSDSSDDHSGSDSSDDHSGSDS